MLARFYCESWQTVAPSTTPYSLHEPFPDPPDFLATPDHKPGFSICPYQVHHKLHMHAMSPATSPPPPHLSARLRRKVRELSFLAFAVHCLHEALRHLAIR